MKNLFFLLMIFPFTFQSKAQLGNCTFKEAAVTINFGSGDIEDANTAELSHYNRVMSSCPTDGHYTYTSYTSDCFRSDWQTLAEDHTPNDVNGNMMIVNASPTSGTFLTKRINGLKGGTTYEFSVWMLNVCKISDKCPFPLLPRITMQLETTAGKILGQFHTGELERSKAPDWIRYRAFFTTPPSQTSLTLTMVDHAPGGCGNDFALDDITFRECIISTPLATATPKAQSAVKRQHAAPKPRVKKATAKTVRRQIRLIPVVKPDLPVPSTPRTAKQQSLVFPGRPPALTTRANPLVKQIETEAGEIKLDLYDNGEIDGDTVTIYHNNKLLVSRTRLSDKPISFHIAVDNSHPYHELVMVANNLGSIPPNTSVMIVTSGSNRYEVFISSTEKKNAKVVFKLKE